MDVNADWTSHVPAKRRESIEGQSWTQHVLVQELDKRKKLFNQMRTNTSDWATATSETKEAAAELLGEIQLLEQIEPRQPKPGTLTSMVHPRGKGDASGIAQRLGLNSDGARIAKAFLDNIAEQSPGGLRAALDGTSGGSAVPAFFEPGISALPQRPVFVRDLIPSVVVEDDKVDYIQQTVATQNAAPVAAGATKPTSVYTIVRKEAPIRVIAHISEDLDRSILDDINLLSQFISNQLLYGVRLGEESEFLSGSGSGVHLTGILNTSGIQTQAVGADTRVDALFKGVVKVRATYVDVTGIVLHPTDWQSVRLLKDAQGDYITADLQSADPDMLWGYPVVVSSALTQGTALVGNFKDARIFDRMAARIDFAEMGMNSGGTADLFAQNLMRFRAEERVGFAVLRPTSFCTVTGL
jgi:HK97 family phage major capsid protein